MRNLYVTYPHLFLTFTQCKFTFTPTIFRYIAVIHPLHYSSIMTPRRSVIILIIVWTHACFTGTGPFYCGRWSEDSTKCHIKDIMPPAYTLIALIGQYFVFSLIMIILYCKIFQVAKLQKRKIHEIVENLNGTYTLIKDTKSAKTLAMVLGAFLASWSLFFCMSAFQVAGIEENRLYTVYIVGLLMGIFNSCLNPVIYCWKSSEFRTAYCRLVKKICRRNNVQ